MLHNDPTIAADAIICFTASGSTARRVARERPGAPLLVLTPKKEAARRMGLLWGAHAVPTKDIGSFEEMIAKGKRMALRHGFGVAGSKLIALAGVPFDGGCKQVETPMAVAAFAAVAGCRM